MLEAGPAMLPAKHRLGSQDDCGNAMSTFSGVSEGQVSTPTESHLR